MDSMMNKLRNLDAYPKINEDFYSRTLSGGVITLVSSIVMLLLFISELRMAPINSLFTSTQFCAYFKFFILLGFVLAINFSFPNLFDKRFIVYEEFWIILNDVGKLEYLDYSFGVISSFLFILKKSSCKCLARELSLKKVISQKGYKFWIVLNFVAIIMD